MGVFFGARVINKQLLTPDLYYLDEDKPVILLQLKVSSKDPSIRNSIRSFDSSISPIKHYMFRVPDGKSKSNFMIERKYTVVSLPNTVTKKKRRIGNDGLILSFIISLLPHGKMSSILFNAKEGKMLLVQGPRNVRDEFWDKIDDGVKQYKTVFMLAAGTGILPLIQIIDYYLFVRQNIQFFLVWLIKSPKHDFERILGLSERERKSSGYFKWVAFYTSRHNEEKHQQGLKKELANNKKDRTSAFNFKNRKVKFPTIEVSEFAGNSANKDSKNILSSNGFWQRKYTERRYTPELLNEILSSIENAPRLGISRKRLYIDDNDDDVEEGEKKSCESLDHSDILALVSGAPVFDQTVVNQLKDLGYKENQVISFRFC